VIKIKTASAKAKGRMLQKIVMLALWYKYKGFDLECGIDGDISSREMGQSGTDVRLSPKAKKYIPFDIECKNQENISIWSCLEQCEKNTEENRIPLLIFKRNRSKIYACIEMDELLKLVQLDE